MKNEEIRKSGQKDEFEVDTASTTDLAKATTETREMALRVQFAEKQVGGTLALWYLQPFL